MYAADIFKLMQKHGQASRKSKLLMYFCRLLPNGFYSKIVAFILT